ncbi:MAG: TetR/AcrR family transcriptional regulator [Candidatus Omnitrophota bacterium]
MEKKELLRQKILNAARGRMIVFGFRKVTMDEIAGDLSMSKNTIYKEFTGKEEIARCLVLDLEREINRGLEEIEQTRQDPLKVFSDSIFLLRKKLGPWFERFFKEISAELPDLWEQFLRYRNEKILSIRFQVERGVKKGIFRKVNPAIAVEAYLGAVKAVVNPRFLEQEALSFERALEAVLDIWASGILKKGAGK